MNNVCTVLLCNYQMKTLSFSNNAVFALGESGNRLYKTNIH